MHSVSSRVDASPCFQLKGGLFTLTSIQLLSADLLALQVQLEDKIKQAPKFFNRAPIVIDCQYLTLRKLTVDFQLLTDVLRSLALVPVGVRGIDVAMQEGAIAAGLAVLSSDSRNDTRRVSRTADLGKEVTAAAEQAQEQPEKERESISPTMVITKPVRSGQQFYARGGDLLVLASVGHGAELLADGHIHVYGPLRGRALAGVSGDQNACIFTLSLEAELISIAGQYRICDDFRDTLWKESVKIQLQDNSLKLSPLFPK